MLIKVIQCIGYTIGPVVPARRSNKGGDQYRPGQAEGRAYITHPATPKISIRNPPNGFIRDAHPTAGAATTYQPT